MPVPWLCDQEVVYADTSLFCRLAECQDALVLMKFKPYAGDRVRIVKEVHGELADHAARNRFPRLASLPRMQPIGQYLNTPAVDTGEFLTEIPLLAKVIGVDENDHPRKNFGEAAMILQARKDGAAVVLDEHAAIPIAESYGLTVLSTRDVVVELVEEGLLDEGCGLDIWREVTGENRYQIDFEEHRERYRARSEG